MTTREFWAAQADLIRDTSHLFDKRDAVLGREALQAPASAEIQNIEPCTDTWDINDVTKVRSMEVENLIEDIKSSWNAVRLAYNLLKRKVIEEDIKIRMKAEEKIIVESFGENGTFEPWDYVVRSLNEGSSFTSEKYQYEPTGHKEALAKHEQLIAIIKSPALDGFKERLNAFKSKINSFVKLIARLNEEQDVTIGYNRFDAYYNDPITKQILNAIPYVKFTPAEVKALQMTETGDLTNMAIAGIKGVKTKGILNNISSSGSGIVGICQLPNSGKDNSADESFDWINANIPSLNGQVTKSREDPRNAVFLTAGYFGKIIELLDKRTNSKFSQIQNCLDKKRIVFEAYNAGHSLLGKAINDYFGSYKKVPLSWDNANFKSFLNKAIDATYSAESSRKEKKAYVAKIEKRLTI